jgi:hypothetical protein
MGKEAAMRVKRGYGSTVEYVYDDKSMVAKIERLADREWRLVKGGKVVGVFDSRAEAIAALDDDGGRR